MTYKDLADLEALRASAETKLAAGDTVNSLLVLDELEAKIAALKLAAIGEGTTRYTYKCSLCSPIECKIVTRFKPDNLSYCFEACKKGIADFKEINIEILT